MPRIPTPAAPSAILDEHRALRANVEALRALLAKRPAATRQAAWSRRVAADFSTLAQSLRLHFAREEAVGLFEDIEEALPESIHACARLRSEHHSLVERLGSLQEVLGAPRSARQSLEAERQLALALLADLARHEEKENELLVRAMEGEEIGALD